MYMKLSKYNLLVKVEDSLILYNSKNAAYVRIKGQDEINKIKKLIEEKDFSVDENMLKALYSRGYIVDDNIDEYQQIKEKIEKIYDDQAKTLMLMVYVTEQCNFRCVYCCEKHVDKRFSDENWESVYKFIERKIKEEGIKLVKISFFGGEPLLECKNIISFSEKLNLLKEKYSDLMIYNDVTTNGYLLTPKIYDKLVSLELLSFQITVDGFAETHNKMRPRVDGFGTWDKIIENLKYINTKEDNANIILRCNFNAENEDSVKDFMRWARKTFDNKKFVFDIHPVVKFSDNVDDSLLADKESKKTKDIFAELDNAERSVNKYRNPLSNLGFTCKCSKKNYYVIKVDGAVSKCEQAYGDSFSVGNLKNGNIVFDMDENLWNEGFERKECEDCIAYPLCAGRTCPVKKVFQPETRKDCMLNSLEDKTVEDYIKERILEGVLTEEGSEVIRKVNPN